MQDGRILALRSVTPSVLMLRFLKLLKVWVSKLLRFFGQWRVRVCVVAPTRFPVPFDKGYVGFSWPGAGRYVGL